MSGAFSRLDPLLPVNDLPVKDRSGIRNERAEASDGGAENERQSGARACSPCRAGSDSSCHADTPADGGPDQRIAMIEVLETHFAHSPSVDPQLGRSSTRSGAPANQFIVGRAAKDARKLIVGFYGKVRAGREIHDGLPVSRLCLRTRREDKNSKDE